MAFQAFDDGLGRAAVPAGLAGTAAAFGLPGVRAAQGFSRALARHFFESAGPDQAGETLVGIDDLARLVDDDDGQRHEPHGKGGRTGGYFSGQVQNFLL